MPKADKEINLPHSCQMTYYTACPNGFNFDISSIIKCPCGHKYFWYYIDIDDVSLCKGNFLFLKSLHCYLELEAYSTFSLSA